jgi:hypothetical protein
MAAVIKQYRGAERSQTKAGEDGACASEASAFTVGTNFFFEPHRFYLLNSMKVFSPTFSSKIVGQTTMLSCIYATIASSFTISSFVSTFFLTISMKIQSEISKSPTFSNCHTKI